MKFTYQYKFSGGERHAGVCEAPNKDAVFAILKTQGIKPFDVKLAPGFVNRILSFGKRGIVIGVLSVVCLILCAIAFRASRQAQSSKHEAREILNTLDSTIRRQVIGDESVIDRGVRTAWSDVFPLVGDRFLAAFAIPGAIGDVPHCDASDLKTALGTTESDAKKDSSSLGIEARQIRAIVSGMKDEARAFVAAGGSLDAYMRRLAQRQREENEYYARARNEIETLVKTKKKTEWMSQWERRNAELKKLGIKTILMPESTDENSERNPLDELK